VQASWVEDRSTGPIESVTVPQSPDEKWTSTHGPIHSRVHPGPRCSSARALLSPRMSPLWTEPFGADTPFPSDVLAPVSGSNGPGARKLAAHVAGYSGDRDSDHPEAAFGEPGGWWTCFPNNDGNPYVDIDVGRAEEVQALRIWAANVQTGRRG
jgi:hypothetical protein